MRTDKYCSIKHYIFKKISNCDLSLTYVDLFRVPLTLRTKARRVSHFKLKWNLTANSSWLQSSYSESGRSAAHLLRVARWLEITGMRTTSLRAYRHPWWRLLRSVWLNTFRPFSNSNCICSWIALSALLRQSVNSIYSSPFAVVARGRPCPGRRLISPVSWNRFHSHSVTFVATPTASATLLCVYRIQVCL